MSELELPSHNRVVNNPENPAPQELLKEIVTLEVPYIDMEGLSRIGSIEVHESLADDVRLFFRVAHDVDFPIERIERSSHPDFSWDDDILMASNITSGFNYRTIKDTDNPSKHSLGMAFDVNPRLNPYIRIVDGEKLVDPPGSTYDPNVPGTLYADHPLVYLMKIYGWRWGGEWPPESGRVDYQHFER